MRNTRVHRTKHFSFAGNADMARTKSDNFDDIRATILDAAAALFAKNGFRNTNIIDIGAACNASKSRMYHYFPSKEAMLAEMLGNHVSALVAIASDLVSAPIDPRTRLRNYFLAHLKYYYEQRDRHTVLIEDVYHLPDELRAQVNANEQKLVNFLCALLREINAQKFKDRQAATTHAMLMYGMLNWTYTWYQPTGRLSLDSLADQATDMCLHGIV
ncbi:MULTISPECIES: TetR/AcrR family transcriptional regulator [unclassified Variovorax]|jgi:AcrR family transcriptional regulator|uniref:TetR/AcrR family transcriptional regulator n=1 Tax=unclassified Variovorax TaxID=663243 RepID=UPI001F0656D7|nr:MULTISPECIES: TetR/AcrR family transcriptional regulator [unclassified Variovorax]